MKISTWIGTFAGFCMLIALILLPYTVAKAVYDTDVGAIRNAVYNLFLVIYTGILTKGFLGAAGEK